ISREEQLSTELAAKRGPVRLGFRVGRREGWQGCRCGGDTETGGPPGPSTDDGHRECLSVLSLGRSTSIKVPTLQTRVSTFPAPRVHLSSTVKCPFQHAEMHFPAPRHAVCSTAKSLGARSRASRGAGKDHTGCRKRHF